MSEKMYPIPFKSLMNWIVTEYAREGEIFGVHTPYYATGKTLPIFGETIETPFGPAAGPNSQLAQNIIAAYFAGARFFEVKTVQKMDGEELAHCVPRPCILAADEGYNVIVMPGYAFGGAIVEAAPEFPDVKFIALDVAAGDLLETAVAKAGKTYDYTPDNWDLSEYVDMSNVYCAVYQEELCGYMAGYAAVKLGYKNLGFLGGMAVPAVVRYGYGFVQGVDAAAADLGLTDVSLNYVYGGQFFGDADITAVMDTWYAGGTEVVFACGGGIYTSAVDAAKKVGAKVIGVDVDQAGVIAGYAGVEGMTVTSAMKGLYPTTYDTLTDVIVNGNWDAYKGKIATLGLVSGDDPELNYVQIPMGEGTQWSDSFTQDDYKAMVKDMFDGKITVSNDVSKAPSDFATVIAVEDQGAIKG